MTFFNNNVCYEHFFALFIIQEMFFEKLLYLEKVIILNMIKKTKKNTLKYF
jgi:hypothetical protein